MERLKREHKAECWCVFNGDIADKDRHRGVQVVTRNEATITKLTLAALDPALPVCDSLFFTRGTPAHTGKSSYLEEWLAEDLEAVQDDETGNHSWWELPIDVNGVYFHIAHHRRTTRLPWTMGGAANRLAAHLVYEYAKCNERRPDVVIRSHGHTVDESSITHPIKVIFTPAWQLRTEFTRRIALESLSDIGGLVFICRDNGYTWQWIGKDSYQIKRRQPIKL